MDIWVGAKSSHFLEGHLLTLDSHILSRRSNLKIYFFHIAHKIRGDVHRPLGPGVRI